jgi:membrane protease YdiL (CAAX protease family)
MLALLHAPFWLRLLVVTRAAVIEETLFRGYGIERLQELTGNRWIAGGVTLAIFAMVHYLSGGWIHVVTAGWAGLVLTVFYFWRRDLGANIVAHWVLDGLGFLVLAQIIR